MARANRNVEITDVIFDVGEVIVLNTGQGLFEDAARAFGLGDDVARVERVASELIPLYQKGSFDERGYWDAFAQKIGYTGELPADWNQLWTREFERNIRVDQRALDLAATLRRNGYQTPVLSNTIPPHVCVMRERAVFEGFDPLIFSCDVGMRKPDREIYEQTLRRSRVVNPAQAVFIDDGVKYVDAARAVGMQGIHYQNFDQLCDELRALGVRF